MRFIEERSFDLVKPVFTFLTAIFVLQLFLKTDLFDFTVERTQTPLVIVIISLFLERASIIIWRSFQNQMNYNVM